MASGFFYLCGALFGLSGCAALPGMIFTLGNNDSWIAASFAILSLFSFTPVCVFALWRRELAAIGFLTLAGLWAASMLIQSAYEKIHGIHGMSLVDTLRLLGLYCGIFLSFGAFALVTHLANWPQVVARRESRQQV